MTKFKKTLNLLLLLSFIVTVLVPLTGVPVHKMASALFLILAIVHTVVYRKTLGAKKYLLLGVVFFAFLSGLLGMIFDHFTIILSLHKVISIASVFFLAIHIFVKFKKQTGKKR